MRARRLIAGRYRLEAQLGSGGMGVVWRATDEELHRVVAVKRALSAEGAHEPQRAKLLKREAMAVAKVNHPNVVTLFDIVTAGDELWLVMEYLPARNLAEQGTLPPGQGEQIGDFTVIKHPAYDGEQCSRTVMLPDKYTLPITAKFTSASYPVDLCAVADSAVSTAVAKFAQGLVPRRQVTRPADSAINLNACALPDSDILALLPGVDATRPERTFGDWECRWHSTTSSLELLVRFDQRLPLTASDRLCKLVTDIAEPLAAKLPG